MAQRMLARWQQHSAEETIYIILCVHTGMSVWLRPNKRDAVRKGRIVCLSIIVCSLCLAHKNPPYCYSTFLYMPAPLPISFLYFLLAWSHGIWLRWILIPRSTLTIALPLLFLFCCPGHEQHKVIYLPAKLQNKKPVFWIIDENHSPSSHKSHIGCIIEGISDQAFFLLFVFLRSVK